MELKYLDQVVYETLRINPVLAQHSRECNADFTIEISKDQKVTVQKGMNVWIPVKCLQNDPEYYDEPDQFNPDRFNDEYGGVKRYRDSNVLLPFGDGPRICLGQRFAMSQMKCCISHIIANYHVTVDPKTPKTMHYNPEEMMMAFKEKVYLNFTPINQ